MSQTARGRPLPAGFVGLALEYRSVPSLAGGRTAATVNPVLVALVRALDPGGGTVLRIGGQSADRSWWPVPGMARPPGITYDLTPGWVASAAALSQALGARLILGLGLEADDARIDAVEARNLIAGLGPYVEAVTIGNEPVLYSHIPWYRTLRGDPIPWYETAGRPVFARPASYDAAQFEREWSRAAATVPAGVPLAGPDLGTLSWLDSFERRLGPGSRVRYITVHAYPLSVCDPNPGSLAYPSVPDLLTVFAATAFLNGLGPRIALAHRYGAKFLIDEMGSISCNGRAGVSDTLASALWLLDSLFAIDAAGIDGVQLHTFSGLPNDLFDFADGPSGWRGMVRPLYYGALMFTQAAPPGSRLLSTSSPDPATLRAWATVAPDHRLRVTLIDDSLSTPVNAVVRLSRGVGAAPAALERLQASSAYATQGITLGGHGFGPATATGVLPPALPLTVAPSAGAYRVRLAAGSAALLTIPAPAPAHRSRR
ncbi:MAG TPA: glycosyl hydrolase family 79 C-terminal domain-containing protein [Solirubrobacteraceae bacterium]|nr:glycosyl hydrolase family 79 C-terminal domain-containing protein [Solirubrobacteraceae bacterium]